MTFFEEKRGASAERLVEVRAGGDGEEGTEDDLEFTSVNEELSYIGISEEKLPLISGRVSVADQALRMTSKGKFG